MAGHSHAKNIMRHKAVVDAKRGKLFSKLSRYIIIAARMGGGDPAMNLKLRYAIDKARSVSMPKENIERAIKKGTGELEGVDYQDVTYEGYGPGGVALVIAALTDNPTRTVADVRHKMSRLGGNLGTPNSVAFLFDKKGQLTIDATKFDEDSTLEAALDAGAEDFAREDTHYVVTTSPADFHSVKSALEARKISFVEAEPVVMVPKSTVKVEGKTAEQLLKLMEEIEELDDVQKVWANFDIDVADMAAAN
jgi:YebC/PmpR family DNA-binding regulatory protein